MNDSKSDNLEFEYDYYTLLSNAKHLPLDSQLELFCEVNELMKIKLQNESKEKLARIPYEFQIQQFYNEIKISAVFGILFSILTFIFLTSLRVFYELIIKSIEITGQSLSKTTNLFESIIQNTQSIISYTGLVNAPLESHRKYSRIILENIYLIILSIDESSQYAKIAGSVFVGLGLWLLLFIFLRILHTQISFGITGFHFKGFQRQTIVE
jgi:predicted PurR-regulated permease PerM